MLPVPGSAANVSSDVLSSSQALGWPAAVNLAASRCGVVAPALVAIPTKRPLLGWQVKHHVKTVDAHPSPSGGILILVTGSLQVGLWWHQLCCQPGRGVLGSRHARCTAWEGMDVTALQAHIGLCFATAY